MIANTFRVLGLIACVALAGRFDMLDEEAATAAAAEPLGFDVEVLSDATGAIDLANEAGTAPAHQVHETLMALLHSNWAAVTDAATWTAALRTGTQLAKSDLVSSAARGRRGA